MERLGQDFKNIDNTINDIYDEFKNLLIKDIRQAIRNGSMGIYGKTFTLSTQEVCFWIREYLKTKKTNLGI